MKLTKVELKGIIGQALEANRRGRLSHFIVDADSPAIAVFSPRHREHNLEGDWYGEHAGKWLYAAAKGAARSDDTVLAERVRDVADYLVSVQEDDGYLGTYAPERRFMRKQPPKPGTWDGAPSVRTWDIWTHSYLILGLIEAYRHLGEPRYLEAARKIGDLCWRTLGVEGIDINELGNHHGMSATVLMDPATELYFATGERRYLDLALLVLNQANANPALALLTRAVEGIDASEIATGKAYQLAWNLVGLAKLHRATGREDLRLAVDNLWRSIRDHHLTLGGGPWGGVAHRSREVFNPAGVFSPYGYVETCSTLAWIQLNRELLAITGEARYAEEIERSAYNDLLGAQAPDGEDWCYYVFPNGKRVHTTYWRCCKSSGAMALEELPAIAYGASGGQGIVINLLGPGRALYEDERAGRIVVEQTTVYPFDSEIRIAIEPERAARFAVRLRVPAWAQGAKLRVGGVAAEDYAVEPGGYAVIEREWQPGDAISALFPMEPRMHRAINRNVQESRAPDGSPVQQQVLRFEYLAITRGPLVYASELIDGFKIEETLRLPKTPQALWLRLLPAGHDGDPPRIGLDPGYRAPIVFQPYYVIGGRRDGAWRLTWMQLAPEDETQTLAS